MPAGSHSEDPHTVKARMAFATKMWKKVLLSDETKTEGININVYLNMTVNKKKCE